MALDNPKNHLPHFYQSATLLKSVRGGIAKSGTLFRFCHPPTVASG